MAKGAGVIARLRAALAARGPQWRPWVALLITCLGTAALLSDLTGAPAEPPRVGEVATRDVVATVSYTFVDEETTSRRQQEAAAGVLPVFEADLAVPRRVQNRVAQAFDMARRRAAVVRAEHGGRRAEAPAELADVTRDFVAALGVSLGEAELASLARAGFDTETEDLTVDLVGVALRRNVIADRGVLPNPARPIAVVERLGDEADEDIVEDYAELRTPDEARQAVSLYLVERFGGGRNTDKVDVAASIARALVVPTVTPDPAETERRRAEARAAVAPVELQVQRGTRLVRAGDVVDNQQIQKVRALREAWTRGGGRATFGVWLAFTAMIVLTAVAFSRATVKKFASRPADMEAMGAALLLVLGLGRLLLAGVSSFAPGAYDLTTAALLVPVAGGAMVVRILANSESALVWSMVASILAAAMLDQSVLLGSTYFVTSLAAAGGALQARERLAVLRSGLQAGLLGAGMVLLMVIVRSQNPAGEAGLPDWRGVAWLCSAALFGGVLSAFFALGAIPAFELLGVTTDYKLLELANLNHPLLRQLMLRAPGTYHHSVIVGSLSEAACEAIGANALLARVACYFHDIGKGLKPQYFVENVRDGQSRHERLSPEQSAQLIINHVRDGAALAAQHKLPRPVADQIFMHHGTGIIQYFYNKAQQQAGPGVAVDEAPFRYPGPKPDSREAGVIMLADKVEAACRTIQEPTEARIRAMIQQILNSVMADGQFDSCPLTVKELYIIADVFTNVLLGIYHHRIEYPQTAAISSGRGKLAPVPRQGTITLEVMNPLRPPPPGSAAALPPAPEEGPAPRPDDYESADQLPQGRTPTLPLVDDS